jgi:hypothetical protein
VKARAVWVCDAGLGFPALVILFSFVNHMASPPTTAGVATNGGGLRPQPLQPSSSSVPRTRPIMPLHFPGSRTPAPSPPPPSPPPPSPPSSSPPPPPPPPPSPVRLRTVALALREKKPTAGAGVGAATSVAAAGEVERGERREAAHCSQPLVRHVTVVRLREVSAGRVLSHLALRLCSAGVSRVPSARASATAAATTCAERKGVQQGGACVCATLWGGADCTVRGPSAQKERERESGDSHGRWKRPCLQTAHMTL